MLIHLPEEVFDRGGIPGIGDIAAGRHPLQQHGAPVRAGVQQRTLAVMLQGLEDPGFLIVAFPQKGGYIFMTTLPYFSESLSSTSPI